MWYEALLKYVITFVVAYLFGAIPWGYIIGRIHGIDIREHGSKNIGATNITRTLGKVPGRICFLLDFIKGFLPVITAVILIKQKVITDPGDFVIMLAAFATVAGHIWPIYLKFKGGKGISTSAGTLLAIAPYSFLCSGIVWLVSFLSTRYVSLASIMAALFLPVTAIVFSCTGIYRLSVYVLIFLSALALLAILRHSSNIKRLLNGTENKFVKKQ